MKTEIPPRVLSTIDVIAAANDVTTREVLSRNQEARVVRARRAVCGTLRKEGWHYSQIGRWLNRDHTAVMHLVRTYRPDVAPDYDPNAPDESGVWAI